MKDQESTGGACGPARKTGGSPARLLAVASIALALSAAGCASTPSTPEQAVEQRARAWAEARNKADWRRVYELLAPAYRGVNAFEGWRTRASASTLIQNVEVASVRCVSPERCTIGVNQQYRPPLPHMRGLSTQYVEQNWLLVDGQWYLLPAD